ncbi:hypothetical protein A5652_08770 [Mycobacterium sp. 1165178.9]|nr:hypothetical protein A5652_08770 [Mycobacterium sp. 1165178.9]
MPDLVSAGGMNPSAFDLFQFVIRGRFGARDAGPRLRRSLARHAMEPIIIPPSAAASVVALLSWGGVSP